MNDGKDMIGLKNVLFGTEPSIIHAYGRPASGWEGLVVSFFKLAPRQWGAAGQLTIFTWNDGSPATVAFKPAGLLERCLQHLGVPHVVLSMSSVEELIGPELEPVWAKYRDAYYEHGRKTGRRWVNWFKIPLTVRFLEKAFTTFVMGLDSSDVLLLERPQIILETFARQFDCQLVFSTEPSPQAKDGRQQRLLNSGGWIGRTKFARAFFKRALEKGPVPSRPGKDQDTLRAILPEFSQEEIQLDARSVIFQPYNERNVDEVVINYPVPT